MPCCTAPERVLARWGMEVGTSPGRACEVQSTGGAGHSTTPLRLCRRQRRDPGAVRGGEAALAGGAGARRGGELPDAGVGGVHGTLPRAAAETGGEGSPMTH